MYTCFDLETTGLSTYDGAIVEVAAIRTFADGSTKVYSTLVSPHCEVEPDAFRVHGISTEKARSEGGNPTKVFQELKDFFGDSYVIAHNGIKFDVPFLRNEMTRYGLTIGSNQVLDTVRLASHYLCQNGQSAKLEALCKRFGIINERAHRAMSDTKATLEVFKLILRAEPDLTALWQLCGSVLMMDLGGRNDFCAVINKAIESGLDVEVEYKSHGKPAGIRWLGPRRFSAEGSGSYKFVAYCFRSKIEKNFVIGRIIRVLSTRPTQTPST